MAAQPSFALTGRNAKAVASICRRLDGIPLAIELAAARVRSLAVDAIAERLSDRFALLTSGDRTVMPRHRTLRALIDWSYDLLVDDERVLLRRLSVFAGGFTLDAAETVAADDALARTQVVDVLTRLVEKSLVTLAPDASRYALLETVREYAQEKLVAADEIDSTRGHHLRYFVELAEHARSKLFGDEQVTWLARLDAELDNVLAAHAWCDDDDDGAQLGLRLAYAVKHYWLNRGLLDARPSADRRSAAARAGAKLSPAAAVWRMPARSRYFMGRYDEGAPLSRRKPRDSAGARRHGRWWPRYFSRSGWPASGKATSRQRARTSTRRLASQSSSATRARSRRRSTACAAPSDDRRTGSRRAAVRTRARACARGLESRRDSGRAVEPRDGRDRADACERARAAARSARHRRKDCVRRPSANACWMSVRLLPCGAGTLSKARDSSVPPRRRRNKRGSAATPPTRRWLSLMVDPRDAKLGAASFAAARERGPSMALRGRDDSRPTWFDNAPLVVHHPRIVLEAVLAVVRSKPEACKGTFPSGCPRTCRRRPSGRCASRSQCALSLSGGMNSIPLSCAEPIVRVAQRPDDLVAGLLDDSRSGPDR